MIQDYTLTDRLLGKIFSLKERFTPHHEKQIPIQDKRDIVLIPFGMGIGNTPTTADQYPDKESMNAIFDRMSRAAGFDLHEYESDSRYGNMHDGCCWAVADDLFHMVRLINEFRQVPSIDLLDRLQVLPHSAGIFLTGWLTGILSLSDMMRLTHECSQILVQNEEAAALEEVSEWFYTDPNLQGVAQGKYLKELRRQVDPAFNFTKEKLAARLHGKLQFVFSPTAGMMQDLVADVEKEKIDVHLAIRMTPHCVVFAGNALESERFFNLFTGARKIAMRRITLQIRGTTHCARFDRSAEQTQKLLQSYLQQNCLRDPVIPFINWSGEWVRSKEGFVNAVAGNANQLISFDKMVECAFGHGGKYFLLMQSGTSKVAGDVFDGIIRSNVPDPKSIHVYKSVVCGKKHPLYHFLSGHSETHVHPTYTFDETIGWYEQQLEKRRLIKSTL